METLYVHTLGTGRWYISIGSWLGLGLGFGFGLGLGLGLGSGLGLGLGFERRSATSSVSAEFSSLSCTW